MDLTSKISIRKNLLKLYIFTIIFYSLIYYNMGKKHIQSNGTYVDSLYFSTTIMATVGFGDIVPISNIGKLIVMSQQLITIIYAGVLITSV